MTNKKTSFHFSEDSTNRSFDQIRGLVNQALNTMFGFSPSGFGYFWIKDIYDDYCIVEPQNISAVEGTFKISYSIDDQDNVTLGKPEKVKQEITYVPVQVGEFSLDHASFAKDSKGDALDDFVIKSGKLFESGNYPDKQFDMSNDELKEAVDKFSPVDLDIEHKPSILDGKLGKLFNIYTDKEGKELYGDVAIPKALAELIGDEPIRVSCTWDKPTKSLVKLALVRNPRVADAAVMAAFSNDNSERIETENKKIAEFVGARNSANDKQALNQVHDLLVGLGADCQPAAILDNSATSNTNSTLTEIKQDWHSGYSAGTTADNNNNNAGTNPDNSTTFKESNNTMADTNKKEENSQSAFNNDPALVAKFAEQEAANAALARRLAELEMQSRREKAVGFAEEQLRANKIVPAQREYVVALFEQAAKDDVAGKADSVVVFSAEKQLELGSRVEGLKALFAGMPAHSLTKDSAVDKFAQVKKGGKVVFDDDNTEAMGKGKMTNKQDEEDEGVDDEAKDNVMKKAPADMKAKYSRAKMARNGK